MIRTQIYLTKRQRMDLTRLAVYKGENRSHLIRQAIEYYIVQQQNISKPCQRAKERIFHKAFGMWKNNLTDFTAIRKNANQE